MSATNEGMVKLSQKLNQCGKSGSELIRVLIVGVTMKGLFKPITYQTRLLAVEIILIGEERV